MRLTVISAAGREAVVGMMGPGRNIRRPSRSCLVRRLRELPWLARRPRPRASHPSFETRRSGGHSRRSTEPGTPTGMTVPSC